MSDRYRVIQQRNVHYSCLEGIVEDQNTGNTVCKTLDIRYANRIADLLNQAEVERKHELMAESVPAVPYPGDEKEGS